MTTLSDPGQIRDALKSYAAKTAIPDGSRPVGGIVNVESANVIKLGKTPLVLDNACGLRGVRETLTVLQFDGGPGTGAIVLKTWLDHRRVHYAGLENIGIYCPNGAWSIMKDPSVGTTERCYFKNVLVNGGGVYLPGTENYFNVLEDFEWKNLHTPAAILGGRNTLSRVYFWGEINPISGQPYPRAAFELTGRSNLTGQCRIEGTLKCPQIMGFGMYGSVGNITSEDTWIEPHASGPSVHLNDCDWRGNVSANWPPDQPWTKQGRSRVWDDNGQEVAIAERPVA